MKRTWSMLSPALIAGLLWSAGTSAAPSPEPVEPTDAAPNEAAPNEAVPNEAGARAPEPGAEPTDARTLLRVLATIEGLEARFIERKRLALLRAPLVSEGRLFYTRPGYLARFVETPSPSSVRIGPKSLEVNDASGSQRFDLRSRPEIKTFVESFVHVVAGDYDALASTYSLGFVRASEPGAMWLLTLVPLGSPLSDLVERLEIRGQGYHVAMIHVLEKKGDTTEIVMTSVDPQREFTTTERLELFGLPPHERAE